MTTISDKAAIALKAAVATRGVHKGRLLAKCPPSHTLAAAAWQAAMINSNPYKVSIAAMMFFSAEQREVYYEINAAFEGLSPTQRIAADRDRAALEALGVW